MKGLESDAVRGVDGGWKVFEFLWPPPSKKVLLVQPQLLGNTKFKETFLFELNKGLHTLLTWFRALQEGGQAHAEAPREGNSNREGNY